MRHYKRSYSAVYMIIRYICGLIYNLNNMEGLNCGVRPSKLVATIKTGYMYYVAVSKSFDYIEIRGRRYNVTDNIYEDSGKEHNGIRITFEGVEIV